MSDDLDNRAADLAQIKIFEQCSQCSKAHDTCEPLRVDIDNIKRRIDDLEDTIKDIRGDMRNALIWLIGILLTIVGTGVYMLVEQYFNSLTKPIGG